VIGNGVPVERLRARVTKRNFVLALGRICPEKGFHLALDAAARAGVPFLLGGEVFAYPEHEAYFRVEILPRMRSARYLGPVGFERKRRLMAAARAVLIPSLAAETSSLVAMEALACGTPVIAFANGALPEIIEHGKTGFLVSDTSEMAAAIRTAGGIDPERCRHAARERFPEARMVDEYINAYRRMVKDCAALHH
jgi:glycosyltransferase involved in cell wall biosynthesis